MRRALLIGVLLGLLALTPAVAFAHRRATKAQRTAILAAVVRQHELSRAQAACQVVTLSTVNRRYGVLAWPTKLSSACRRVAANGVIVEHKSAHGWRLVAVGSALRCPIKGVPGAVARDLDLCS
jgi:ribosomal protein S14